MDETFKKVLLELVDLLDEADILYALTGSMAFAIQGLPCVPADIDITTDKAGAYIFGDLLKPYTVTPVFERSDSTMVRSFFGSFEISDVQVEVMGDMQVKCRDKINVWDHPRDLQSLRTFYEYEGRKIPVLPLHSEADFYQRMGRPKKANWLAQFGKRSDDITRI